MSPCGAPFDVATGSMQQRGVISRGCHPFPGLVGLHSSIQTSWPCPVACYDIGLTPEQRRAARSLSDLTVLDLPDDPLISALEEATRHRKPLAKAGKRIWPLGFARFCPCRAVSRSILD